MKVKFKKMSLMFLTFAIAFTIMLSVQSLAASAQDAEDSWRSTQYDARVVQSYVPFQFKIKLDNPNPAPTHLPFVYEGITVHIGNWSFTSLPRTYHIVYMPGGLITVRGIGIINDLWQYPLQYEIAFTCPWRLEGYFTIQFAHGDGTIPIPRVGETGSSYVIFIMF